MEEECQGGREETKRETERKMEEEEGEEDYLSLFVFVTNP